MQHLKAQPQGVRPTPVTTCTTCSTRHFCAYPTTLGTTTVHPHAWLSEYTLFAGVCIPRQSSTAQQEAGPECGRHLHAPRSQLLPLSHPWTPASSQLLLQPLAAAAKPKTKLLNSLGRLHSPLQHATVTNPPTPLRTQGYPTDFHAAAAASQPFQALLDFACCEAALRLCLLDQRRAVCRRACVAAAVCCAAAGCVGTRRGQRPVWPLGCGWLRV